MNEVDFNTFGISGIPNHLSEKPFNVQLVSVSNQLTEDDEEIITLTLWDGSRELSTRRILTTHELNT